MNKMNNWIFFLIIIVINDEVLSYGSGGPVRACVTLLPGHGVDKQTNEAPHDLVLKSNEKSISVSIVAKNEKFAGFMIQARNAKNRNKLVEGVFSEDKNTQIRNCNSDKANTLTHRSGLEKEKIHTKWTPIDHHFSGLIVFRATIVESYNVFWTDVDSNVVEFSNGRVKKISESKGTLEMDFKTEEMIDSLPQKDPQKVTQSLDYAECNQKLCLGLGSNSNCVEDKSCQLLIVGGNDNKNITFEMNAITSSLSKWYAMGFSEDNKMGSDSVIDCYITSDGKPKLGLSFNDGYSNAVIKEDINRVKTISTTYRNGILSCKFTVIEPKFMANGKEFNILDNMYHMIVAFGDLNSDSGDKIHHIKKLYTETPINLEQKGVIVVQDITFLIRIHGSFMVIAWVGFVSIAILMARHYKQVWVSNTLCGVKIWFAFHRGLMATSLALMILAQLSIFYYLGLYRIGSHQLFGSFALLVAFLQPIGALFRPSPDASNRWLFNWMHWLGGNVGHILALITIFLASNLSLAELPKPFIWTMISFVIFHVLVHIILQFHSFFMQKKTADIALHEMNNRSHSEPMQMDSPGTGFRRFILGVYVVIVSAFVITLIIFVTIPKKTLEKMALT